MAKASNYRIPKQARERLNAKRYLAYKRRDGFKVSEINRDLRIPNRCDYIVGGELVFLRKDRKDGSLYMIPLIVGGERCPEVAHISNIGEPNSIKHRRCVDHVHSDYEVQAANAA